MEELGYEVVGVDPSKRGIRVARQYHPGLQVFEGSAYGDIAESMERVHWPSAWKSTNTADPHKFTRPVFDLLADDGIAIISTPYHGYLKNLAPSGRLEALFPVPWDGGHGKFFSPATISELMRETGFLDVRVKRSGRLPPIAKSMLWILGKQEL